MATHRLSSDSNNSNNSNNNNTRGGGRGRGGRGGRGGITYVENILQMAGNKLNDCTQPTVRYSTFYYQEIN